MVAHLLVHEPEALAGLTPEQRETSFEADGALLRFRSDLRPSLIFGRHDLLQDAPISRVVLLSCRNVLMYFTADTQTRVLERFSFALHEHGLLLLGKAEMLLTQSQLFTPVYLPQRIFRPRSRSGAGRLAALAVGSQGREATLRRTALAAFAAAPAAQVVLDPAGTVVLLNARAQRDLGLREEHVGRPCPEFELSHRPLELRGTVAAVQASGQPADIRDVSWTPPRAAPGRWDVRIAPLTVDGEAQGVHLVPEDVSDRYELQLQSTDEELQTLNDELRERTLEVDRANGFLQSNLSGLELAVVVVDTDDRVQLWNGGAERLTGLRTYEAEGRRLFELDLQLPSAPVRALLRSVVVAGEVPVPVDLDLTDRLGRLQRRRLTATPLVRTDGEVHGAVVTLSDTPPDRELRHADVSP